MNIKKPQIGNLIQNIPFIISGCAFALLFSISLKTLIISAAAVLFLTIAALFVTDTFLFWKSHKSILSSMLTFCILGAAVYRFYSAMIHSSKVQAIADRTGINHTFLVFGTAAVGGIVAFYFVNSIADFVLDVINVVNVRWELSQDNKDNLRHSINISQLMFIAATAVVTITICSKSSPLYPLNDWVDSNCFLTVGKSMLHGKVPYRDLFEQKGPLLYMLHVFAAWISETSFLGVYFIEIIACCIFLYLGFKTMQLYRKGVSALLNPILAAVVYSASCFCHGDSAEELCLPLLAYAIYVGLKGIRCGKVPSNTECLLVGVTSACVLWIKFSILGFYFGWICVPMILLIRNGKVKKLFQMIVFIAGGVLLASLPVLLYFGANHALGDLWTVYFYDNLFAYSSVSESTVSFSLMNNLWTGIQNICNYNFIPMTIAAFGGLTMLKKKGKTDFCFILASFIGTFLLVYIGGRAYKYYSFIFSAFVPIGVVTAVESIRYCYKEYLHFRISNVNYRCRSILVSAICVVFLFVMCENTYLLHYKKIDMPQYQFAEMIEQVENATLLNYGFLDGGFYTTTGIVPNCRYFCKLNIELDAIMETQKEYVAQSLVDFVVTRDEKLESDRYVCVATSMLFFEGTDRNYYLYRLIP